MVIVLPVTHKRDPINITSPATYVFEKVSIDFAGPFLNGKLLLIFVDEFIHVISLTRFEVVKPVLIGIFFTLGILSNN